MLKLVACHIAFLFVVATKLSFAIADERPNIVIIYTDDQGYGDVSCLNPDCKFQTPNLDRLAREGMTFTDGHAPDTVCTPSRYGLLTGRYSWRTKMKRGVMGAEGKCLIADGRMTIASFLRDQGYHTGMVGKWHLGMDFPGTKGERDWTQPTQDMPLDKGFDYFWGIPASMNFGVLAWFDGRFPETPPTLWTRKKPNDLAISDYRIMSPYDQEKRETLAKAPDRKKGTTAELEVAPDFEDDQCLTRFTEKAVEWIRGKADDARNGKPFFLYLPYTSPHKPVIPLKQFRGQGSAGAYGEFMIETDHHVGTILNVLDEEKIAENTIVIFTSDNGPENTWPERERRYQHRSNGGFREGKRSIYEGGHRVPFLVRWPAKIKAGSKSGVTVCQTDFLATFAEVLGQSLPDDAGEDSVSFFKAATENEESPRVHPLIHHSSSGGFAIRDGKWKLVLPWKKIKPAELFDLELDPRETKSVAAENVETVKRLTRALAGIVRNGRTTPGLKQANDTPVKFRDDQ